MKKIGAIVQIRVDSTRLPKKALSDILGKPMTIRLLERVQRSELIDEIIVATTKNKTDDDLVKIVEENNIKIYRGSTEDVLDRYYKAAKQNDIDIIVRITGDCPLVDPEIVDNIIRYFIDNDFDYVSNTIKPTFPDGICVEVFSYNTLEKTWNEAKLMSEREHVTPYITKHTEIFEIKNFENNEDLSDLRWTVDEPEDLEFVREIYKRLYNKKNVFHLRDVLKLLEKNPKLKNINTGIMRNEGYFKSLKDDKIVKK